MFDIGWTELLILGALALIVVGPKDLPRMLRSVGQFVGKMRGMAREFQRTMNDAAREADLADMQELKNIKTDLEGMQSDFRKQAASTSNLMNSKPLSEKGKEARAGEAAAASAATAPSPEGETSGAAPAGKIEDTPAPPAAPAATAPSATATAPKPAASTAGSDTQA